MLGLKTTLGLYLAQTLTKMKNFKFVFQKIKSATIPIHHVKGQTDYQRMSKKRGVSNVTQFVKHPVGKKRTMTTP